jgi:histone acetyltransferase
MEAKLDSPQSYPLDAFVADAQLVWDNCRTYNGPDNVYWKCARTMERFFRGKIAELSRVKEED